MGPSLCWSDGGFEFVECGGQPEQQPGVDGELVVATAEVLNERVATDHYPRRSLSPEPPHRPEPDLQPAVVAFHPVVLVLAGGVQDGRNHAFDGVGQSRCPVGDHLGRVTVNRQGGGEQCARGGDVSSLRDVHVDHLPMLVDRPVDVGPDPADLDLGLVDKPPIPGQMPSRRPGRVDQQRGEPLHPPLERAVVDLDATLGDKLFEVPVGQPVPEVPAHRRQDSPPAGSGNQ